MLMSNNPGITRTKGSLTGERLDGRIVPGWKSDQSLDIVSGDIMTGEE